MQRESNWRLYLTIAVTLVSLFLIYPTMHYVMFEMMSKPPKKTEAVSAQDYEKKLAAYDKKKQALQRQSIKLGLDLIGGVDVLLKIDKEKALVHELEVRGDDIARRLQSQQIGAAVALNKDATALVVDLTDKASARQAANILSEYVKNGSLQSFDQTALEQTGKVALSMPPTYLQNRITAAIQSAERTIRERVDKFGVTQPSVSLQGTTAIRVQVPGEKDPQYVIEQIIRPASLEFYALHKDNDRLVQTLFEPVTVTTTHGQKVKELHLKPGATIPLGYREMPGEAESVSKTGTQKERTAYIVKKEAEMHGGTLQDAYVDTNPSDIMHPIQVGLTFDKNGAVKFKELSKRYLNQRVAISLDGVIYSAPVFQSIIPNGQARITGSFSAEEARDLALVLKAGAMPAELEPAQKRAIGPTLGAQSIRDSMSALLIACIVITVFMVVYYTSAGVIAIIALILNVLIVLACLDLFNATLTLSGIGGIILTIGMAVDANVLIYERIREEMWGGRDPRAAVRAGFSRAFSVIFDSNLTTLLTALVLLQFGEGTVQGFALTMCFGLVANLFTGLTVTYALTSLWVRRRGKINVGFLHMFRDINWDFIGMRKISFSISIITVVAALFVLGVYPRPQYAVDLSGGVVSEVRLLKSTNDETQAIRKALDASGIKGDQARVQRITGTEGNDYVIRTSLVANPAEKAKAGDLTYTEQVVTKALKSAYPANDLLFLGTPQSVSKEVGQGFQHIAFFLVIGSSIAILAYLWFRFELIFGVAAVIALVHDFIFTLGLLVLLRYQVSLDIVSGLMILLGFSVNDTIVIFDRVRENSHTMQGRPFKEICNAAMNKSMSRTIITSGTVFLVMIIMFFFGGNSLQPLAMTMIIGCIVGTYSSDFVATPLVYWWNDRKKGQLSESLGRKKAGSQALEGQPLAATAGSSSVAAAVQVQSQRRGRR